jgi:calpain-7
LSTKAYYKALGGYDIPGSNPSPDIYAFTGWIPERISLREGFQREKEWKRVFEGWKRGEVLVTLGTGVKGGSIGGMRLVESHAYGVVGRC